MDGAEFLFEKQSSFDPLLGEDAPGKPFEESFWTNRILSESDESSSTGAGTILTSAVALTATCIGTGLFALPYTFHTAGLGLGSSLLVFFAATSVFMSYLLCQSSDWAEAYSYEEVMVAAFGRIGAFLMEVAVVWLLLGAMTSALVVVGSGLASAAAAAGFSSPLWKSGLVVIDVFFIATPLSFVQTSSSLRYSNTIAVVCTMLVGCMLIMRGLTCSSSQWSFIDRPSPKFSIQTLQVVPIIMLSLGCQVQVPVVYGELRRRSLARMTTALASAGGCCVSIYIGVAVFGILAVNGCSRSGKVLGNVLDSFPSDDGYALAMRCIMALTLTLVYPMLCLPCRSTIDHLLFGGGGTTRGSSLRHAVETVFITCSTLLLAECIHDLARVFSFTGATAGALICYILPPVSYLQLRRKQTGLSQKNTRWQALLSYATLACIGPLAVALLLWDE